MLTGICASASFNTADIVVVVILAVGVLFGIIAGFAKMLNGSLGSILAIIISIVMAIFLADKLAGLLDGHSLVALLGQHPRLAFGALSIFTYVGAEVSIGSVMTNYLMQHHTLALAAVDAGKLVSFYWGGAMVGRFIGSAVLRVVSPGKVLACCALMASLLASTSALSAGMVAAVTLIGIGLFNSIMFPTIFSLAIEGLGSLTSRGSGVLCLAIVGGAIVPVVTGAAADHFGLSLALFVPAACYIIIASYGWYARFPADRPAGT